MRIVIVGAGVIGFNLAKDLSSEHEIFLIEEDAATAEKAAEKLDVKVLVGNGADPSVLTQSPVHYADLVIAVTASDEVNVVVCALAAAYGAKYRVARVRNASLARALERFRGGQFYIDDVINPEELAASAIVASISTPGAREVADFAEGRILFRVFDVEEASPLAGMRLSALNQEDFPWPFLVIAVMRQGKVFFPKGDAELHQGDRIYVLLPKNSVGEFIAFIYPNIRKYKKIVVYGATKIGTSVVATLRNSIEDVVLIEENPALAEEAAGQYQKVRVINGSASEVDILKESGIEAADAYIAVSSEDHVNIVSAVLAKKMGAETTIISTAAPDYMAVMDTLDIDTVINARFLAVDQILKYVRGRGISAISSFAECEAEALELVPEEGSPITRAPLKDLSFPSNSLVGAVCRGDEVLLANGNLQIRPGERVIVFCQQAEGRRLQKLFMKKSY